MRMVRYYVDIILITYRIFILFHHQDKIGPPLLFTILYI